MAEEEAVAVEVTPVAPVVVVETVKPTRTTKAVPAVEPVVVDTPTMGAEVSQIMGVDIGVIRY